MSVNVSVRLDARLAERLRVRARAAGETLSDRLRRYAEEGARRDEHPLLTFRDGPSGRRAGLIGGPDVWEVAMWLDDLTGEQDPAATLVAESGLSHSQVDSVLRYRAAYADKIAARIQLHRDETAAADPQLKLLLDEMYPPVLAEALRAAGIEAHSASELGLAGRSDPDILAAAIAEGLTVLTENVSDFARISAEHLTAGRHHPGVLIALSSRFSRRPAGVGPLVASIRAVTGKQLEDRIIYLRRVERA